MSSMSIAKFGFGGFLENEFTAHYPATSKNNQRQDTPVTTYNTMNHCQKQFGYLKDTLNRKEGIELVNPIIPVLNSLPTKRPHGTQRSCDLRIWYSLHDP